MLTADRHQERMTVPNASMGAGETEAMTRHTGCGLPSLVGRDLLPWGLVLHAVRVMACIETAGPQSPRGIVATRWTHWERWTAVPGQRTRDEATRRRNA